MSLKALLALLLLPVAAHGQWTRKNSAALPAAPGLVVERQEWSEPAAGSAEVHLVSFQPKTHRLRVLDQGTAGSDSLAAALAKAKALAGINGGYFHPDRRPLGLVIAGGATIHPQERARLLSGLLLVSANGSQRLLRPTEPRPRVAETDALQAGPFLVDGGVAVSGLEATRRARRSVVLVDANGRWSLVSTSRLTLAETAALLAARGNAGEPRVVRALNLDGGSSTALWARGPTEGGTPAVAITEFGTVRNFLAVVPREPR